MAGTPLGYRLRLRNATDTADELVLSSVGANIADDVNRPFLTDVPSVDGASADLIAGTVDVGTSVWRVWDEPVPAVEPPGGTIDATYGPGRAWRILVTGTESDPTGSNVRLSELQFRGAVDGPSLSTGGTAIESGHTSALGFPLTADHAFNGTALDENDAWGAGSETPPPWVGYIHPTAITVGAIAITMCPSLPQQAPTDFAVQYRDTDDGPWITAWTVAHAIGWIEGQTRVFAPGHAWPLWRIVILETADGSAPTVGELEFLIRDEAGDHNACVGGAARASDYAGYVFYPDKAFNGTATDFLDCWIAGSATPAWIGYAFPGPTTAAIPVVGVAITARAGYSAQSPVDFLADYLLPDGTWHTRFHFTCLASFWVGGGRRAFFPEPSEIVG